MRLHRTILTITTLSGLMLLIAPLQAEEGLWQRFNKSVTQTSKEIGKGVKEGGQGLVKGARQGSKEANDALTGKGSGKKGSSGKQ